jgi:DNA-binding Lrp family transcriptional regulator
MTTPQPVLQPAADRQAPRAEPGTLRVRPPPRWRAKGAFVVRRACDRKLLAAVQAWGGGCIRDLALRAGLSEKTVRQRLSVLRAAGVARWSSVFVPARAGRPVETVTYVKLRRVSAGEPAAFEALCRADPQVASAAMVTGSMHYVLTGYFTDLRQAREWAWVLRSRPEVADVNQKVVQTRAGHALAGSPLY